MGVFCYWEHVPVHGNPALGRPCFPGMVHRSLSIRNYLTLPNQPAHQGTSFDN